jgi:hypothetical protein
VLSSTFHASLGWSLVKEGYKEARGLTVYIVQLERLELVIDSVSVGYVPSTCADLRQGSS